jgi:hypothetical protein
MSIATIITDAADDWRVKPSQVYGPSPRGRQWDYRVSGARWQAMAALERTGMGPRAIAGVLRLSHTSVLYGLNGGRNVMLGPGCSR